MKYRLAVAAAAVAAALCSAPLMAAAQDFNVQIGRPDRPPPPPPGYPPPPGPPPGYDDDDGGPPPPPRFARNGCDPEDAMDEARDMGFRRPHVVDISPRRVVVDGFSRRGPDRMYFANVRGCPVMRR